jgi:hypothetical protein
MMGAPWRATGQLADLPIMVGRPRSGKPPNEQTSSLEFGQWFWMRADEFQHQVRPEPPSGGGWRLRDRQRTADMVRTTGLSQPTMAVVSTTTVSLSASRECRSGGMTSRSPL